MSRRERVRFSAHRFDNNLYDDGLLDVLIFHRGKRITRRHVFLHHSLQDSSLLNRPLHNLSLSKTDDAPVNLSNPAILCPKDLRPDLIYQKTHARIHPERIHLSARQCAMEVNAAFKEQVVYRNDVWAILSRDGQSTDGIRSSKRSISRDVFIARSLRRSSVLIQALSLIPTSTLTARTALGRRRPTPGSASSYRCISELQRANRL